MTTNEPELGPGLGPRKPRTELRHWSTYTSVGAWYADYRGYVPIQQAAALDRLTRDGTLSFRDTYRLLLRRGAIIHIDPADDLEPGTSSLEDLDAQGGGTGSS
jgi:hypothetical protein